MRARWIIALAVAVLGASCIDYTGLGSDRFDYTKVGNTGAGASGASGASGEQCLSGWTKCQDGMSNDVCVNTQNDPSHCGACGNMCSAANATAACVVGQCGIGNCLSGSTKCQDDLSNNVCVNTQNDPSHCGACGNMCVSGKFCQVGACIPVPEGMVNIPAGTFTMGDDQNTEKAGMVTVSAFFMDVTEVTTEAYAACVLSNKCTTTNTSGSCNAGVAGRENHPINCVDWNQATAYCAAQGLRLPTEEEWEYAARGTDGRLFPWGNTAPTNQLCWNGAGNDLGQVNRKNTCAVSSYSSGNSPFGLADMSGNVWEWTSSTFGGGAARVYRGGGWNDYDPSYVRSANRHVYEPTARHVDLGLRCAGPFSLDP